MSPKLRTGTPLPGHVQRVEEPGLPDGRGSAERLQLWYKKGGITGVTGDEANWCIIII